MRSCCHLVHPQCRGVSAHPTAHVLEGVAVPVTPRPPRSTGDGVAEGLVAWIVGMLLATALVVLMVTNLPLTELLQTLG